MRYLRSAAVGITVALVVWLVGMFLMWDAYPFWQTGKYSYEGAAVTRAMMLGGFAYGAFIWFGMKERRR